jgi:hypothetical protein
MDHILDRRDDGDLPSVLGRRLYDGKRAGDDGYECGSELAGDLPEALDRVRAEPVPDVRALPLGADPAGLAEHLQVVADGRLSHVAAGREIACADAVPGRELTKDREPGRVRRALQEQGVGIGESFHRVQILTRIDIGSRIAASTFIDTAWRDA